MKFLPFGRLAAPPDRSHPFRPLRPLPAQRKCLCSRILPRLPIHDSVAHITAEPLSKHLEVSLSIIGSHCAERQGTAFNASEIRPHFCTHLNRGRAARPTHARHNSPPHSQELLQRRCHPERRLSHLGAAIESKDLLYRQSHHHPALRHARPPHEDVILNEAQSAQ